MHITYFIEPYELSSYGLTGKEDFLFVDSAIYPEDLIEGAEDKLDIHAGAYETAAMANYYPELLNQQRAKQLPDCSLNSDNLNVWFEGGECVKQVVPYGYAGDPANFEPQIGHMEKLYDIMCRFIAEQV